MEKLEGWKAGNANTESGAKTHWNARKIAKLRRKLAKEKPRKLRKLGKKKTNWAGCEPPASQNRGNTDPPALLGLLEWTTRNDKIRENQREKNIWK